ncbi:MAG: hypothetical protein GKR96_14910 [Gammaproteobacteria bacterium]|nr:hypothetical protein [Gammaproteobacteria bacterium]
MNILEFQAKGLLDSYGVGIPAGKVVSTVDEALEAAKFLNDGNWMIKAQIYAGSRQKGHFHDREGDGGIVMVDSIDSVGLCVKGMLGHFLVTDQTGRDGLYVEQVYVEQALKVEREWALSLSIDDRLRTVVLMLCRTGGAQIESLSKLSPDEVHMIPLGLNGELSQATLSKVLQEFDLQEPVCNQFKKIIKDSIRLFYEKDASLVEINPLGLVDGSLTALDAKMSFDDNALFRQPDIKAMQSKGVRKKATPPSKYRWIQLSTVGWKYWVPVCGGRFVHGVTRCH